MGFAVASTIVALLIVGRANAAPKQIVFSGTLQGPSRDVGAGQTGDTFHTAHGTFTATSGLKSGSYTSTFAIGTASFFETWIFYSVTGTFTLRTPGVTITAVVIPATSSMSRGVTPSWFPECAST